MSHKDEIKDANNHISSCKDSKKENKRRRLGIIIPIIMIGLTVLILVFLTILFLKRSFVSSLSVSQNVNILNLPETPSRKTKIPKKEHSSKENFRPNKLLPRFNSLPQSEVSEDAHEKKNSKMPKINITRGHGQLSEEKETKKGNTPPISDDDIQKSSDTAHDQKKLPAFFEKKDKKRSNEEKEKEEKEQAKEEKSIDKPAIATTSDHHQESMTSELPKKLLSWWKRITNMTGNKSKKDVKGHFDVLKARKLIHNRIKAIRPLKYEINAPEKYLQQHDSLSEMRESMNKFLAFDTRDPAYVNESSPQATHPELQKLLIDPVGVIEETLTVPNLDKKQKHEESIMRFYEKHALPKVIRWMPVLEKLEAAENATNFKTEMAKVEKLLKSPEEGYRIPDTLRPFFWRIFLENNFKQSTTPCTFTKNQYESKCTIMDNMKNTEQIFKDLSRTKLNHIRFMSNNAEIKKSLLRILLAYSNYKMENGHIGDSSPYSQSMNFIGSLFLLVMNSEYEAFQALCSFYAHPEIAQLIYSPFMTLIKTRAKMLALITNPPKQSSVVEFLQNGSMEFRQLCKDFEAWSIKQGIDIHDNDIDAKNPFVTLDGLLIPLFVDHFRLSLCTRLMDMLLYTGNFDSVIAFSFALIKVAMPELMAAVSTGKTAYLGNILEESNSLKNVKRFDEILELTWKYYDYMKNSSHAKKVIQKTLKTIEDYIS